MKRVLFLCTGNSCRSQMAEAIVNARLGDSWQAVSAGTKPAGYVHPKALTVLSEIGVEHTGRSKLAEECPIWLGQGKRVHQSFPDPAKAEGTEAEIMDVFRSVRDDIEKEMIEFLKNFS